nr:PREDICTED: protein FAM150A [Latimeria chalumnae]|eukprot:XP_006000473.1 PREDICTED: protein FAM150A [Latimeria chalumnae]
MDSKESRQKERRTLLDLILQVIGDNQGSKTSSRRYSSPTYSVDQDYKLSSRERAVFLPRLENNKPIEIVPRNPNLKDKFIKHFTGPVTFSAECSKHFHRLYHNTRDCSTPAYYKRCARLLTRLAMSPLCSPS